MAQVTSAMVGAWLTGMAEFSDTVIAKFRNRLVRSDWLVLRKLFWRIPGASIKSSLGTQRSTGKRPKTKKNEISGDFAELKPAKHNNTVIEYSIATAGQTFVSYSAPACWTFDALPTILRRSDADGHTL